MVYFPMEAALCVSNFRALRLECHGLVFEIEQTFIYQKISHIMYFQETKM